MCPSRETNPYITFLRSHQAWMCFTAYRQHIGVSEPVRSPQAFLWNWGQVETLGNTSPQAFHLSWSFRPLCCSYWCSGPKNIRHGVVSDNVWRSPRLPLPPSFWIAIHSGLLLALTERFPSQTDSCFWWQQTWRTFDFCLGFCDTPGSIVPLYTWIYIWSLWNGLCMWELTQRLSIHHLHLSSCRSSSLLLWHAEPYEGRRMSSSLP